MLMKIATDLNEMKRAMEDPKFDRVFVACHRSPDGDATGSAFALAYALRKMGKKAKVFCPDPFGEKFSYLTQEEKDLSDFEPKKIVTVDVAAPEMLCQAPFADRIDLALDHHRINTVSAKLKFVDPQAASCGEIITDLIRLLKVPFDSYLARALYTAVVTDTGCFRYSNTTQKTFLAAAHLASHLEHGDLYWINKLMFETKPYNQVRLEAYAAEHVAFAKEGRVAYLAVTRSKQEEMGASYQDLDSLVNVIRQIRGVQVCIIAKEREEGTFKVSVRSEDGFDASSFCAHFGGGGHFAAAGCTLLGTDREVLSALLEEVERRLP